LGKPAIHQTSFQFEKPRPCRSSRGSPTQSWPEVSRLMMMKFSESCPFRGHLGWFYFGSYFFEHSRWNLYIKHRSKTYL
jgi:hypothetical protein